MVKEKLFWKICFPYTAIALVPSLVKHAVCQLYTILMFHIVIYLKPLVTNVLSFDSSLDSYFD